METINTHQQSRYEKYEKNTAEKDVKLYEEVLSGYRGRAGLRILDIGGASGTFALTLADYFGGDAEIYVLDSSDYDTWQDEEYTSKVHFIKESVENLCSVFQDAEPFDLIFANRVFHHFIGKGWRKTLKGMDDVLGQIRQVLAENGTLCIKDHFYNGMVCDKSTSFMIFSLTTCSIPAIAKTVQKNGAHSAGVGVCFQSEKMWLKRLKKNGFVVDGMYRQPYRRLAKKKRFLLLCKEYSLDNNIYVKKTK